MVVMENTTPTPGGMPPPDDDTPPPGAKPLHEDTASTGDDPAREVPAVTHPHTVELEQPPRGRDPPEPPADGAEMPAGWASPDPDDSPPLGAPLGGGGADEPPAGGPLPPPGPPPPPPPGPPPPPPGA